jgi:hypothetical protein
MKQKTQQKPAARISKWYIKPKKTPEITQKIILKHIFKKRNKKKKKG